MGHRQCIPVMRPWYPDIGLLRLCQAPECRQEYRVSRQFPTAMQKSSTVLAAPRSRKATARVALVEVKEPTRSLLSDCFKQFGIEAVTMTGNVIQRMQREKFEACVLQLIQ